MKSVRVWISAVWLSWVFISLLIFSMLQITGNIGRHNQDGLYCSVSLKEGVECQDFISEFVMEVNFVFLLIFGLLADFTPSEIEPFVFFTLITLFLLGTGWLSTKTLTEEKNSNDQN